MHVLVKIGVLNGSKNYIKITRKPTNKKCSQQDFHIAMSMKTSISRNLLCTTQLILS